MIMNKQGWIIGLLICVIVFVLAIISFGIFKVDDLPGRLVGSLIGVVITAVITVFLLRGQSANAETREKNMKVFEKKLAIHQGFLKTLRDIVDDNVIEEAEVKELIFQTSYVAMHASKDEYIDDIIECLSELKRMTDHADDENYHRDLATCTFRITGILKKDLYGETEKEDYMPKDVDLFAHLKSGDIK